MLMSQVAQRNNRSTAEMLLLQEDIDLDAENCHGQTPLHICGCYGSIAVAKILLRCKVGSFAGWSCDVYSPLP